VLLEVRPGEGGDDAAVFAQELRRALVAYASAHGCSVSPAADTPRTLLTPVECRHLEAFVGVHRIQRIPRNDKRGRRHTSTVSVALVAAMSVSEEIVREGDIEIRVKKGSGPGGQHRNKTESAVEVRHLPTGLVVSCEDERSQWLNKQKAHAELRRLTEVARQAGAHRQQDDRVRQISSGERPAKTFTWNEQRDELLDHSGGRRWRMSAALKGRL
jgi:peptide chain release factor 1